MSLKLDNKSSINSNEEEIINLLVNVGLTKSQALVFLELIKNHELIASELCNNTLIKSSKIYGILSKLENLGLIITKNMSPKRYGILSLDESLDNLNLKIKENYESKLNTIKSLNLKLRPLYDSIEKSTEFALIIKGEKNVNNHILNKIYSSNKNIKIVLPNKLYYNLFKEVLLEQLNDNISIKVGYTSKHIINDKSNSYLEFIALTCDLFYVVIDENYLISVSNWTNKDSIYAIATTDKNLIQISLNNLTNPSCLL